jgi:glycosyltransferase involved in cell wall biosynthesis
MDSDPTRDRRAGAGADASLDQAEVQTRMTADDTLAVARQSVTLIVPAFNEEQTVEPFLAALVPVLAACPAVWQVLLVDDGSTDRTAELWRRRMQDDPRLGLVGLTRNVGKEAALLAGMRHARGDALIPIDIDLQDPPALIPVFLARWREGADQVVAVRNQRDDPAWRRWAAAAHYRLLGWSSRVQMTPDAGDFRLLDRAVVTRLLAFPEVDRYTKGLYALAGGRMVMVPFDRPQRVVGRPAQNLPRLVSLAIDSITGFSEAPLRLLLPLGILFCLIGCFYLVYLVAMVLGGKAVPQGYPTLLGFILIFGGVQTFALGLIGEYAARIYREVKRRPPYHLAGLEGSARQPRAEGSVGP